MVMRKLSLGFVFAVLCATMGWGGVHERFVVLTAAQDPAEVKNSKVMPDFGLAALGAKCDVTFQKYRDGLDLEEARRDHFLLNEDQSNVYWFSFSESPLNAMLARFVKEKMSGYTVVKDYDDLPEPTWTKVDECWRSFLEEKRPKGIVRCSNAWPFYFRIAPMETQFFSLPRYVKGDLVQRGYLVAPEEVVQALDGLSKQNYEESIEGCLIDCTSWDSLMKDLAFNQCSTSILGIYDKVTGRIFISNYGVFGKGEHLLIPFGRTKDSADYESVGYMAVGLSGISSKACWCELSANIPLTEEEQFERTVIDFMEVFSLKTNVSTTLEPPKASQPTPPFSEKFTQDKMR